MVATDPATKILQVQMFVRHQPLEQQRRVSHWPPLQSFGRCWTSSPSLQQVSMTGGRAHGDDAHPGDQSHRVRTDHPRASASAQHGVW